MASPINSAMDSARVEIHGQTKRGQIPYEKPWVSYEKPWVSTKNHGFPMKNNGFLWKTIGFLWKTMGFLGMLKILGGMGVIELWWKSHWVGWNWALFSEKMMINQWMEWGVIEWGSSFSHRAQISKSGEVYVQHNGQYIGFWGDAMCIYIYLYVYIYIIIYMYQCVYIYIYIYIFAVLSWHSEHLKNSKKFVLEPPLETCLVLTASEELSDTSQSPNKGTRIFYLNINKILAQDGNENSSRV